MTIQPQDTAATTENDRAERQRLLREFLASVDEYATKAVPDDKSAQLVYIWTCLAWLDHKLGHVGITDNTFERYIEMVKTGEAMTVAQRLRQNVHARNPFHFEGAVPEGFVSRRFDLERSA